MAELRVVSRAEPMVSWLAGPRAAPRAVEMAGPTGG